MPALPRIAPAVEKFRRHEQGTVAMLFALAVIPVMVLAGGAIDYMRASQGVAGIQAALDSATLAVAQAEGQPDSVRTANGRQYLRRNVKDEDFDGAVWSDFKVLPDRVSAKATARIPTTLLKIAKINYVTVTANSEVNRPVSGKAEIVLVLDYSGSMGSSNKYRRMATAAKAFINDITAGLNAGSDVKFGLVPFSDFVALDLPKSYVLGQSGPGTWTGCTQDRYNPFNTSDATPILSNDHTKFGRVHHLSNQKPDDPDDPSPAEVAKACSDFMAKDLKTVPLTNDYKMLQARIDSMSPFKNTHIALGMEIGWHLISPNEPFSQGKAYTEPQNHKFIVLLTDGKQTTAGWGPGKPGEQRESVADAEANLEEICRSVKKKDVTVFTIGYDLEDEATLDRLRDCASDGKFYEPAVSGDDLSAAFADIGAAVRSSLLYLSK
jgi:Flp pilus assembly protein TadG